MRKNSIKNTRINGEVLKELSNIIRGEIKDPRIHPMTSVVAVEVAPDLKSCKAYISVLGDEALHPHEAGAYGKPEKYTADPVYPGSVHRVRCQHVQADQRREQRRGAGG